MQATTLGDIFAHPSFILILTTILIVIGNIMVGVSMLPDDVRRRRYRMHRLVFFAGVAAYIAFLVVTHKLLHNSIFNYFVLFYFLTVVPFSRKMNVTAHAILSSVGLVLLVVVAVINVL